MNNLGAPEVIDGVTGVELPNEQPGRAWLSLHGTLIERSCTNVPSCPGD